MILSALCRRGLRITAKIVVLLLIVVLIPGVPPHATFTSFELDEERPLTGALAPNNILDSAERLFNGQIVGPESIASRRDDAIFVGIHGGDIMRVHGEKFDQIERIAAVGTDCDKPWLKTCGRPLGMRFGPNGRLLIADPYLGLFSVNVDTGEKECIFDLTKEIDGLLPMLLDDIDIDGAGNIYWSDASTVCTLTDWGLEFLTDPTGRLIKFNPKTKENTVLVKNLHFANGVQLSPKGDFVLVCESLRNRVWRHWIKGPKAGTTDIFVDRLPGMPDNIRKKSDGGFYVSLVLIKDPSFSDFYVFLAKTPWLRKLLAHVLSLIKIMSDTVTSMFPNDVTSAVSSRILNPIMYGRMFTRQAIVVELDTEGNIVGSLQGDTGNMLFISQAERVGNNLFLGSPFSSYLGRIPIRDPLKEKLIMPNQADNLKEGNFGTEKEKKKSSVEKEEL